MLTEDLSVLDAEEPSIEGALAHPPGLLVLDCGCGDASLRERVRAYGHSYVGIDPYSASAQITAVGEAVPVRDACFDVVISNSVLEHVLDPSAAVGEIARVLKPGGTLTGYSAFLENFHEQSQHHLSHKALEHLFHAAGLNLRALRPSASSFDYQLANLIFPTGRPRPAVLLLRWVVRLLVFTVMRLQAACWAASASFRPSPGESYRRRLQVLRLRFAAGHTFVADKEMSNRG
jgi:SAM-dependent methyltransferase